MAIFLLNQTRSKILLSFSEANLILAQLLTFIYTQVHSISSAHFHDISVSNDLHFDHYQSCQRHSPTTLKKVPFWFRHVCACSVVYAPGNAKTTPILFQIEDIDMPREGKSRNKHRFKYRHKWRPIQNWKYNIIVDMHYAQKDYDADISDSPSHCPQPCTHCCHLSTDPQILFLKCLQKGHVTFLEGSQH